MAEALFSFDSDIINRKPLEILANSMSLTTPLYHYAGTIALEKEVLEIKGSHKKTGETADISIRVSDIKSVSVGFDDIYKRRYEKSLGLPYAPLVIKFNRDGKETALYVAVEFGTLFRTSKNKEWKEKILEDMAK
jgi:hypothetical protein